jgi:hypothetical protein
MQLTKTTIALLLGLGLFAGACGGDEEPSSPAARNPGAPAAQRPPAAGQQAAVGVSPADALSKQLAPAYPDASASQLDCVSSGILEQLGLARFNAVLAVGIQEKAGARPESARSAQHVKDLETIRTLTKDCDLPVR